MKYIISYSHPEQHYINIECVINEIENDVILLTLPAWRPGRYELGDFARNIKNFEIYNSNGGVIRHSKISKNEWRVETGNVKQISVKYKYYAAKLDAGSCWLDENQLYINGVHCFIYSKDRMNEQCEVQLMVPEKYIVATSLKQINKNVFVADNYDQLVDSPIIASSQLIHNQFQCEGVLFHLWFNGPCLPGFQQIKYDFFRFTVAQIKAFGSFPVKEYHYLFQILPGRFYHGVEHHASTVIALGPGYDLMKPAIYDDLLGVSSHELYHTWNIKAIRPVDMMPYDFGKENYSQLGYVAEGVTTYYGDLFLMRSEVFSPERYLKEFSKNFQKHFDNYGRFNMSVAEASFDTWLDGYTEGVPDRKVSIYTEGSLCALMLDILIRKKSANHHSLDDVMRSLYYDFGVKGIGYTSNDYITLASGLAGEDLNWFFNQYVFGKNDYQIELENCLKYIGIDLIHISSELLSESEFGFKSGQDHNKTVVKSVAPGSPAFISGLAREDEIIAVNDFRVDHNLNQWLHHFRNSESVRLIINSNNYIKTIILEKKPEKQFYGSWQLMFNENLNKQQKLNFKSWSWVEFQNKN
jgi:predicted metalloprotease with PDZ domain